nr:MAG TPA: apelin receptor protein [Caudoviricetes sp.]
MKKNYFATLSTIISVAYKLTFIVGTIAGFILWIVWWRDYKKFLKKEDGDIDKVVGHGCNSVLDNYEFDSKPTWFDEWKRTEAELDATCKKAAEDDDDELY